MIKLDVVAAIDGQSSEILKIAIHNNFILLLSSIQSQSIQSSSHNQYGIIFEPPKGWILLGIFSKKLIEINYEVTDH